jgi:hypothetical protein
MSFSATSARSDSSLRRLCWLGGRNLEQHHLSGLAFDQRAGDCGRIFLNIVAVALHIEQSRNSPSSGPSATSALNTDP